MPDNTSFDASRNWPYYLNEIHGTVYFDKDTLRHYRIVNGKRVHTRSILEQEREQITKEKQSCQVR